MGLFRDFKNMLNQRRLKDSRFNFLFDKDDGSEVVVIDTETTGLDIKKDEILSIGAIKIRGNKILSSEAFEVYIKNTKSINAKSISLHGIRECDLKNAKNIDEALEEFLHFIGSRTLVGYYLEFDVAMLNRYLSTKLGITLPNKMTEVSELYYDKTIKLIPQGNIDLRFDTILKKCKIPNMGQHNAVNDAIMTAMIYLKLTKGDIGE